MIKVLTLLYRPNHIIYVHLNFDLTVKQARVLDISNDLLFWSGKLGQDSMVVYTKPSNDKIEAY